MKNRIIALFVLMATIGQYNNQLQAVTEPAIKLTSPAGSTLTSNKTEGWIFSVDRNITVTHLGVYNFNSSYPGLYFSHPVAIWHEDGSTPLSTVTVPAGTGAIQKWPFRYVKLDTPVVLEANNTYIIGAFYPPGNTDWINTFSYGMTTATYVNYLGYSKATGGFIKPNQPDSRYKRFGPNFLMVKPQPILNGLNIVGPSDIAESSSVQYTAKARYDSGSTKNVTTSAVWSLDPDSNASVSTTGLLQTFGVDTPSDVNIYAAYAEGTVTLHTMKTVQVHSLSDLKIIGPNEVRETCFAKYKAVAYYDNNTSEDVTNSASWSVDPTTYANINSIGLLQTDEVPTPQDINISAEYTEGSITLQTSIDVQILLYSPYIINVPSDYQTIQAAIDASCDGDTIVIADGIYTGEGNRDITFKGKSITVKSENGALNCIINCSGTKSEPHRGFYFYNKEGPDSILDGITIINGFGKYKKLYGLNYSRGGAIHCYNEANPTIKNCIFENNQARNGGAIECYLKCKPLIQNCIFTKNTAQDGDKGYGGALNCVRSSRPKLANCLFLSNTAKRDGGAIYSNGGPDAVNCSFISNRAGWGGAIASRGGSSKYYNCLFWDNHRTSSGDDIANASAGTVRVKNCFFKCGLNWPCLYNNGKLINEGGNISGNPRFVDFANGNYHLLYNSPCVEAGTNDVAGDLSATDLSGAERIIDGNGDGIPTVDIGIYEFQIPENPYMLLNKNSFEFIYLNKHIEPQVLSIRKVGFKDLSWEITEDCSWLDVTPTHGTVAFGEVNDINISVSQVTLTNSYYTCQLGIVDPNAQNSPQFVNIVLYIRPIQKLINAAQDGDTIVIEPRVYKGKYNRDIDFKGKKITLQSIDPNCPRIVDSTIIDCNGTEADRHRGFYFHNGEGGDSILNGVTIKNGYAYDGGGIYCNNSSPTIINCNFVDCRAEYWGGGIFCYKSSPLIRNCSFTGNSAFEGGAISTYSYWDYLCSPQIENCHIFGNTASGSGGGINSDCLSTPIIYNCLIHNNSAGTYGGGGISIFQSNPKITGCTIVNNTTESEGCGILQWYEFEEGSELKNCILWGNGYAFEPYPDFEEPSGPQITLGSEMTISYCDIEWMWIDTLPGSTLNWGMGNIDEDPSFVNPTGGDYHLSKYSECINRGDPSYTAAPNETDMDGQPRIMLGQVDIGADEFTFNSVPTACITGGDRTIYTEEPVEVSVTLDGSCSDDIDSTPGTKDDITCFDWYKIDPCNPEIEEFIGCGEIMDCNLACGEHRIVLKTIDKAGTFDTDEVTIVVAIPKVEILIPQPNTALQDVVTLIAEISYLNDVDGLYFSIREPNMGNGITIGYDDIPGVFNSATNMWEYDFDTTQLYDGHYVIIAKAIDIYGYEVCSQVVPFSIRNWVLIDLLPSSRHNRAGRTVPIKFSLKTDKNIDATQPFVYNEDLMIKIFDTANPGDILQTSLFGDASKDYRIDTLNELYITNFKTLKTPAVYEVEIWRTNNNFLIGAFSFNTSIVDRGDFTGDGITDFDDLIIMTENWLGNEKTVDIDPYPNGDGMVNFMDFAVLAQHWMDSP